MVYKLYSYKNWQQLKMQKSIKQNSEIAFDIVHFSEFVFVIIFYTRTSSKQMFSMLY